jgi:deferrochelatase/peroxidase EfeB
MAGADQPPRVTRRRLLAGGGAAGALAVGAGAGALLAGTDDGDEHTPPAPPAAAGGAADRRYPFYGTRQAGVATPAQDYLHIAAFDLTSPAIDDLRALLRDWSLAAAEMTRGAPVTQPADATLAGPADTGEVAQGRPAGLTVTFGLGPTVFELDGNDRFGLRHRQPSALRPLPAFSGEALDPALSGGDLCIQACANDTTVAFHAIHDLARIASSAATLRWAQTGFGRTSNTTNDQTTPRNLMGFKDGTNNVRAEDRDAMRSYVWAAASDGQPWMENGTYLVARRIRMLLDVWDATDVSEQERTVGRQKQSGAPLGARREYARVDLQARSDGALVIPGDAHIRLAAPATSDGQRLLRRGYSFSDGVDAATGQLNAGLFFIAFQRDPTKQFVPIQRRLAAHDAMSRHLLHTASAVFAIPPGARRGGFVGEGLFA